MRVERGAEVYSSVARASLAKRQKRKFKSLLGSAQEESNGTTNSGNEGKIVAMTHQNFSVKKIETS